MPHATVITRLDGHARLVTAALSSRFLPRHDTEAVLEVMDGLTGGQRMVWMAGALGVLFALALVAAQFGVWGLAVYFAAVVILMR